MGNSVVNARGPLVRVIASDSTWIEGEALRQLDEVAKFPGMLRCVGLPDLHPGKGSPVGAAFLAEGMIYPSLVGSDIGCGMAVWATDLRAAKVRPDKLAARLEGLDRPMDAGEVQEAELAALGLTGEFAASLGTPGRGNHFLEIQRVHSVEDAAAFAALGLDEGRLALLVHTGSRGLGERILREQAARSGAQGLVAGSAEADAYLAAHGMAIRYAELNRSVCARRMLAATGADGAPLLDSCHNAVEEADGGWLHRKGAAPADRGAVVIPGSRGDLTYVVAPVASPESLWSLAHGAGRKLARHEARGKLGGRLRREDLGRNPWGGRVVCGDELLLWEEAPGCYKDAATAVAALVAAGLCSVIATLAPLVTFKTSAGEGRAERRPDKESWRRDRHAGRAAKQGGWR